MPNCGSRQDIRIDNRQSRWIDRRQESALYGVMTDENPVDREIKRIEAYLAKSGMPESRLGLLACANARAIERVRNGSASIETLRAVLNYIAANPIREAR